MSICSSGIRDIAYVLKISPVTVISTIRKYAKSIVYLEEPKYLSLDAVEIDEQWSFVGKKKNQKWLWYGFDRKSKEVIAYQLGKRTDESFKKLWDKLSNYKISTFYTDNWASYSKIIPKNKHIISKRETVHIERNNLNLRTHIKRLSRRTICFSKAEDMHENLIKIYLYLRGSFP